MTEEIPWPTAPSPEELRYQRSEPTTWEAVDLGPYLRGEVRRPEPSIGIPRSDGVRLIYPGREHAAMGETESGKSWLAAGCAAVELVKGHHVVYLHYEEGDAASTIERLRLLGVPPDVIGERLRFVAPSRPARAGWLAALLDPAPTLVVHDGVNEAMSLHGADIMAPDGAANYRRRLIAPCLKVGAATLACDHVTKSSEGRGRYAMGSGHKLNAIDGAAFMMENVEPFGRGRRGASHVYVTKDRPGQLRAHGRPSKLPGKTYFGTLVVDDSSASGADFLSFIPPTPEEGASAEKPGPADKLGGILIEVIAAQPEGKVKSLRALYSLLRVADHEFRDTTVREALDDLITRGDLSEVHEGRGHGYRIEQPKPLNASQQEAQSDASVNASRSASPIRGEAREAFTQGTASGDGKQSEAVGSSNEGAPS